MISALQFANDLLELHGGDGSKGPYFLGAAYSAAETLTTPFLKRGILNLKHYRKVDIEKIAAANGLTRLQAWIKVRLRIPATKI